MRVMNQRGTGLVVVLASLAGILLIWFVFTSLMGFIGNKHSYKKQNRKFGTEQRIKYREKHQDSRKVKGYSLKVE